MVLPKQNPIYTKPQNHTKLKSSPPMSTSQPQNKLQTQMPQSASQQQTSTHAQHKTAKPKAVVLLSGGLDSTTCLAWALPRYDCTALSFNYGQRHASELAAATRIAQNYGVPQRIINIDIAQLGGSSLTDTTQDVPDANTQSGGIPSTYVPARNTIFLSYALAAAEVTGANHVVIGVNAVDYSGYPDCRPEFISAFECMANLATKTGVQGQKLIIDTPLIDLSKADIIKLGLDLGVDYSKTVSCYQANTKGYACGRCDSCALRKAGFLQAGVADPTIYQ